MRMPDKKTAVCVIMAAGFVWLLSEQVIHPHPSKVCTLKMYTYLRVDCTVYLSERAVFVCILGTSSPEKSNPIIEHQISSNIIFHSISRARTPVALDTISPRTLQLAETIPTGVSNVTGYLFFLLTESISGMLGFHLDICMPGTHKMFLFSYFSPQYSSRKPRRKRTEGLRGKEGVSHYRNNQLPPALLLSTASACAP